MDSEKRRSDSHKPSLDKAAKLKDDDDKKQSGGWNKTAITVASTFLVAFMGLLSTNFLAARQREELNHRLYIQLISSREQAESDLRKDMFAKIIESFVSKDEGRIESRLLNLELLAYNFHESLNLKPLFMSLLGDIDQGRHPDLGLITDSTPLYNSWYRRLVRVASEIKNAQVSMLSMPGEKCDFVVPLIEPCEDEEHCDTCGQYYLGLDCLGDTAARDSWPSGCDFQTGSTHTTYPRYYYYFDFDSSDVRRKFEVIVGVPPDPTVEDLDIRVTIFTPRDESSPKREAEKPTAPATGDTGETAVAAPAEVLDEFQTVSESARPVEPPEEFWEGIDQEKAIPAHFGVGFFDFPLIDNSRLTGDYRYAVILKKIDSTSSEHRRLEMVMLYFPGTYAGLKDKPYYEDVVNQLRTERETHWWQW